MLVLLVEDDPSTRAFLALYLKRMGHNTLEAVDGVDALTVLSAGTVPDLVITDVTMPRMDGLMLIRAIREGPARSCQVPVIVLTGHATQLALALPAGAQAALEKPVLYSTLEPVVTSLLRA